MAWVDDGKGKWTWTGNIYQLASNPQPPDYPPPSFSKYGLGPDGKVASTPKFQGELPETANPAAAGDDFRRPAGAQPYDPTGRNLPPPAPPVGFSGPELYAPVPGLGDVPTAISGQRPAPVFVPPPGDRVASGPIYQGVAPPPTVDPFAGRGPAARTATGTTSITTDTFDRPPPAPADPGSTPATVDRERIDQLLRSVNSATSGLLGIAQNQDDYSAAQAQLAIGTEQAQRAALGQARSGSRRDRSMLERQAIAEGATLASDEGRSAALLRAQEEDAEKQLRLNAFTKAGELGLNASALEVDVNQLDMQAATNYLNQVFESDRLGLQIDQAEAERITNFTRDMALIAKDYYALSLQERQSVRDDLTRRYGISEQVAARMAELDAQPGFWEKAALGLLSAAPGAVATMAVGK